MDDKKQHIIYTKKDIDNYLQGKMQHDAMHSLERAALQDSFLADAIEGYSYADKSIADTDLNDIEAMILGNKQQAKIVPIETNKTKWWNIAAAIVLFAGVGFASFFILINNDKKPVVSNEKINNEPANKNVITTDTLTKQNAIAAIEANPEKNGIDKSIAAPKSILKNKDVITEQPNIEPPTIAATTNQGIASNKYAGPSTANASNGNYSTNVTNPDATDARKDEKQVAISAAPKTEVARDKAIVDDNKVASNANEFISLPAIKLKRDSSYDAIPITTIESKRKASKAIAYRLSKEDSLCVPVNGWAAFNEYVQQNNKPILTYDTTYNPVTITNSKTGQEVVGLEFNIDKYGNPEKIKVVKSVDEETDLKAVELLKNGPKWQTNSKKQKGRVSIKF